MKGLEGPSNKGHVGKLCTTRLFCGECAQGHFESAGCYIKKAVPKTLSLECEINRDPDVSKTIYAKTNVDSTKYAACMGDVGGKYFKDLKNVVRDFRIVALNR